MNKKNTFIYILIYIYIYIYKAKSMETASSTNTAATPGGIQTSSINITKY